MVADDTNPGTCTLLLTGYVRARSLSVNQLVIVQPMTCLWSHDLVVVLFSFISGSCFWCRGFPVVQNGHPQGSTSFECKKRAGCHGCR